MATIKFMIRSKSNNANIYVRYSINREIRLIKKTGFIIDAKDWSKDPRKDEPIQRNEELKAIKFKLDKLSIHINNAYNNSVNEGVEFNGDWLQAEIDKFNKRTPKVELDIFTNAIQKYIDEAPYKQNAKKGLGLSEGRVKNLKLFKNMVIRYENEMLKGTKILVRKIDLKFVEQYKSWMFAKSYSPNYVGKNIANIRTVALDAGRNGIEMSTQINSIKGITEFREPEEIVFLSEDEQEKIKDAIILRPALLNARKWLLLGCLTGQRAGDLLNVTDKNIRELANMKIIELKQQKTGKLVAIPLLPEALEIVESGLPYKITLFNFNKHIKDICKIAELNTPTKGRKKNRNNIATTKGTFPKYEVVSSHICRRSFATNFYGRIPTPVLMNITAHGTEKMFLQYIGKTTYDNAFQMLDYFSKLKPRSKPAVMQVVKSQS